MTLVTVVASVAIAAASGGYGLIAMLVLGPAVILLVGGPLAIASFVKREQPRWCSAVALLVSLGPAVVLAGSVLNKQLEDAAYQNRAGTQAAPEPTLTAPMPVEPPASEPDLKTVPAGTELFRPPAMPGRK